MASEIINDKLVGDILDILTKETAFPRSSFYCEIQDDFQLLFISISIDDFSESSVGWAKALSAQAAELLTIITI